MRAAVLTVATVAVLVLGAGGVAEAGYKACEHSGQCASWVEKCIDAPGGGKACAEVIFGERCHTDGDCGVGGDCEKDQTDVDTYCISFGDFVDGPDPEPSAQVCTRDADCESGVCGIDQTCKGGGGCSTGGGAGTGWPATMVLLGVLALAGRRRVAR